MYLLILRGIIKGSNNRDCTHRKEGYTIPYSRAGLGYKPLEPIRITRKGKAKITNTCHITVEESNNSKEDKRSEGQRMSAFNRITPSVARPSVFQRLSMLEGENKDQPSTSDHTRLFAFQR